MWIEIGQDALGRWAWIIWDFQNRVLASDDDYWSADLAMEEALRQLKRRIAGDKVVRGPLRQAIEA